jgi:hypothetical protein
VLQAVEDARGIVTPMSPIKELEDVLAGTLPDLETLLPSWVRRLERFRPSSPEWETEHERWLREAMFRQDGVAGLARMARATKRPKACLRNRLVMCPRLCPRRSRKTAGFIRASAIQED